MTQSVKVGVVQMAMGTDVEQNRKKAAELVAKAAAEGARIVCLPELFSTVYFANEPEVQGDFLEEIPGPTSRMLSETAKRHGIILVGGSIFERSPEGNFNTTLTYDERGELIGKYRKTHIPQDPGFYEKNYFTPGDLGYQVTKSSAAAIAPLICFDQWFPEAARSVTLLGAQIIFYPTAIGVVDGIDEIEGSWQEAWETVQRGHAIANGTTVVAVNRVGREGNSVFWGGSFICDAFGKILHRAGNAEEVFVREVDLDLSRHVRESWGFLRNRRSETYRGLV